MEAIDVARRAVEVAGDKQATDIVLLDVRGISNFADFFVICSGESKRQIEAIRDDIGQVLKKEGVSPHHYEGTVDSGWLVLDFGSIIVHIFAPLEREYYQLDRLWSKIAPVITIQ
ncbi:ribosome silencing factor [Chloroflexota bacterium]